MLFSVIHSSEQHLFVDRGVLEVT